MTNIWHTYQTQLAASLKQQTTPAPHWLLVRRAALAAFGPPTLLAQDHDESVTPLLRLPGIWRPEGGGPLQVRSQ